MSAREPFPRVDSFLPPAAEAFSPKNHSRERTLSYGCLPAAESDLASLAVAFAFAEVVSSTPTTPAPPPSAPTVPAPKAA